jgi:ribonuclease HII
MLRSTQFVIANEQLEVVAGVDEAGRGPLAGPVMAAAVILNHKKPILGLADSKTLQASQRMRLAVQIQAHAVAWAVCCATVGEIDQLNILQATLLAMKRAVSSLPQLPDLALIDGKQTPFLPCKSRAIIRGDQSHTAISAASILAKVARDTEMIRLDKQYPQYGFAQHKGYGTLQHLKALKQYGPTPIHRKSFAPVRRTLALD